MSQPWPLTEERLVVRPHSTPIVNLDHGRRKGRVKYDSRPKPKMTPESWPKPWPLEGHDNNLPVCPHRHLPPATNPPAASPEYRGETSPTAIEHPYSHDNDVNHNHDHRSGKSSPSNRRTRRFKKLHRFLGSVFTISMDDKKDCGNKKEEEKTRCDYMGDASRAYGQRSYPANNSPAAASISVISPTTNTRRSHRSKPTFSDDVSDCTSICKRTLKEIKKSIHTSAYHTLHNSEDIQNTELAIQFVESFHNSFRDVSSRPNNYTSLITAFEEDNMFHMTKRFIECKKAFEKKGICSDVLVGFHYTNEDKMQRIQRDGLMTWAERDRDSPPKSYLGDGIYVSNNHRAFQGKRYGTVGLFVAMIKGRCQVIQKSERHEIDRDDVDTIIGNKKEDASVDGSRFHDEIVLQRSCQCLPLLSFDGSYNSDTAEKLMNYTATLQLCLDTFFNSERWVGATRPTTMHQEFKYEAPDSLDTVSNTKKLYCKPICESYEDSECPICLERMNASDNNVVSLNIDGCSHVFHRHCIDPCLQTTSKCPVCRQSISEEPQGISPSGTLVVRSSALLCSGYEHLSCKTFVLTYTLPSGTQKSYQANPGKPHKGTTRIAYIPDVPDGRRLLLRLVYAFQRGLTFLVGTSLSTRRNNVITWSSIHQKTSLSGGIEKHGFPDECYFLRCNEELDALGVPSDPCVEGLSIDVMDDIFFDAR